MKIVVLDAATLGMEDAAWEPFRQQGDLTLYPLTPYDTETIVERAAGADVVLSNKVPLLGPELSVLPSLRLISVLATGYNNVDLAAARSGGVTVCNVPAYSTASTAQHAVALILELCNRVGAHDTSVRAGDWVRSARFSYWNGDLVELEGKTVGIVGFGQIGRRVGATVAALGARVLASARRRRAAPDYPFEWADTRDIFERADVVTLHCPQTEETTDLVNAESLRAMKRTAFLVNTARGGLVDEGDLADALREGTIAGAAVDVLRKEPMEEDCPLRDVPNCIVTPHMAWSGQDSRRRLLEETLANLIAFQRGEPRNVVS